MAISRKAPFLILFGGKRLRKFVDNELSAAKRDVIATSCFADLARISRFHVPEELLEWVVMNIDPKLREYRHKVSKSIVFTRDMMTKVFNVPSGDMPVERLKNTEHTELRNMYRDGEWALIAYLEKLPHDCADDDVVMIKRSFALLAFATVPFLGTNNMVPLDYLGSLLDMDKVHEYAWDEAILAYCMDQVAEFQERRRLQKEFMKQNPTERLKQFSIGSCLPALVIVYVDHLDFPAEQMHGHVFEYSLPRALHVCNADFELAMASDRNKKTLELSVFGKRHIHDRCNTPYALDQAPPAPQYVPFVQVQPAYQEPPIVQGQPAPQLPPVAQAQIGPHPPHVAPAQPVLQPPNVAQAQAAPQPFAKVPTEFNALYEKHKTMFKRELNAALSSFGLVVQGIQCNRMALVLKDVSDAARNDYVQEGTNESNGINFDAPNLDPEVGFRAGVSMGGVGSSPAAAAIIEEASVGIGGGFGTVIAVEFQQVEKTIDELTSGPSIHEKRTRHKRVAVDFDSTPKMKKVKVNADADALYTKYVLHKQKTKKLKDGESQLQILQLLLNKQIKLDIASFPRVNLDEYPQQKTNFDCGFFVILYMENYDGKIMKMFGQDYISIFRKIVAATLFNKPTNEIDTARGCNS
ncbi:hypothetical protein ACQ4PT_012110 [Festuca glaucescens]